jgi:excisionase family DNA binding protein
MVWSKEVECVKMTQTKKKPKKQTPPADPSSGEVLTLAEAATYLRLHENDVVGLVHSQGLPGRLVGGEWRFLKTAIQLWLITGTPTPETRKAAQLAIVGSWKDDPDLEAMVEEIYRKRGRPITEDGSYKLFHGLDRENDTK